MNSNLTSNGDGFPGFEHPSNDSFISEYLHSAEFRDTLLSDAEAQIPHQDLSSRHAALLGNLALSRAKIRQRHLHYSLAPKTRTRIGIVLGMWRESHRIRPCSTSNPLGENSLIEKAKSLEWLFDGSGIEWRVFAVDDGCPENSSQVAQESLGKTRFSENFSVLRLSDGLPYDDLPLSRLRSTSDSVKGGAIVRGAIEAIRDDCTEVVFTDCDNSVHLGQLGLLLDPLWACGLKAVFGDRLLNSSLTFWHPGRVTGKGGAIVLLHLRRLILVDRLAIADATSPFKAFDATYLSGVLPRIVNLSFHFDYDISAIVSSDKSSVLSVPYLFFDSFGATTWNGIGNDRIFLEALHAHIRLARHHNLRIRRPVAKFIEEKIRTPEDVSKILSYEAPRELLDARNDQIGNMGLMSIGDVERWLSKNGYA